MKLFLQTIKYDYLQRTRSYAFLITLCASLAIAYTFVPEPNASYSTIRIADYVGSYNSAWFGYVTAIMTSVFLSLVGFYLVNNGIKTDFNTKVGQIIASTKVSNFKYLLFKTLSNFMVLITIVFCVFLMSILLFFLYNDGTAFSLFQFVKPYVLVTLPALFFIAVLAVVFEVFLMKYSAIQNVLFFFMFSSMMVFVPKTENQHALDVFGTKIVIEQMEESVKLITNSDADEDLSIGYVLGNTKKAKKFDFNGVDFPRVFVLSRLLWILFGFGIITAITPFFKRFSDRESMKFKRVKSVKGEVNEFKEVVIENLSKPKISYSIFPLCKTELLMLFRKGKKWFWIINIIGMVLLVVLPLEMAHQLVLPVLWFLQVNRLSDLVTKETFYNTHYFVFASYKPLQRVLISQLFAGIVLMLFLSLPLMIRYAFESHFMAFTSILLGGVFIVLLASVLGILTQGKKLFEVLFFMIAYANINGIIYADYFGGFQDGVSYLLKLIVCISVFITLIVLVRKRQVVNLA